MLIPLEAAGVVNGAGSGSGEDQRMKPYYEHAGITIYHGDCREVLPEIGGCDALISDPPYGISHRRGSSGNRRRGLSFGHDSMVGDDEPFDPSPFINSRDVILWGANWFCRRLPDSGRWIIWDKQDIAGSGDFSEAEVAWHNRGKAIKIFRHMWLGVQRASENGEPRCHPTQKPVALMDWCIKQTDNPKLIFDPFCGSGPVLIAAKKAGIEAIGIEIEEKYCEIAAKRLSQEVFDFKG